MRIGERIDQGQDTNHPRVEIIDATPTVAVKQQVSHGPSTWSQVEGYIGFWAPL